MCARVYLSILKHYVEWVFFLKYIIIVVKVVWEIVIISQVY